MFYSYKYNSNNNINNYYSSSSVCNPANFIPLIHTFKNTKLVKRNVNIKNKKKLEYQLFREECPPVVIQGNVR